MSFNAIHENKILAKISESTVFKIWKCFFNLHQNVCYMDHIVRKLVFVVCAQQRQRQAWKSTKSDQDLAMIHCLETMIAICAISKIISIHKLKL